MKHFHHFVAEKSENSSLCKLNKAAAYYFHELLSLNTSFSTSSLADTSKYDSNSAIFMKIP